MKFAVVIFACILAVASAQFNYQYNRDKSQYNPSGYYNKNQYNNYNRFNQNGQNGQYNKYNKYPAYSTQATYRPFVTVTTPAPFASSTAVPSTVVPATAVPYAVVPVLKVSSDDSAASIVKYGNEINPDGSYNYFYETSNGIAAQAQGVPRNLGGNPPVVPDVAQGSFSWTSPEGKSIVIAYVADENGYQPSGDAIPTSPPVPPQILRALEYTARFLPQN